jgi:hypothetical protein
MQGTIMIICSFLERMVGKAHLGGRQILGISIGYFPLIVQDAEVMQAWLHGVLGRPRPFFMQRDEESELWYHSAWTALGLSAMAR